MNIDRIRDLVLTLHLSTLTNSTCFPPDTVTEVCLHIPTSSRTSDNLAPPQVAENTQKTNEQAEQ